MTGKRKKDELGAVLGNLRKERKVEMEPKNVELEKPTSVSNPKIREAREAFTSRLRPSQRRWLKRWGGDLEEETGQRVTLEDILEALVVELQDNEIFRQKILQKISE